MAESGRSRISVSVENGAVVFENVMWFFNAIKNQDRKHFGQNKLIVFGRGVAKMFFRFSH